MIDLPIVVLLPDGRRAPRAGLHIEWSRGRGKSSARELWTPDLPLLRLTPRPYKIKAYVDEDLALKAGLGGEMTSEEQTITLVADQPAGELTLRLKGQTGIRGRVMFDDKDQFDHLMLVLAPVAAGREPDLELLKHADDNDWVARSRPEFSFLDLAPGTYAVGVKRNWSDPVAAHAVCEVRDGIVQQNLTLPALDPDD
ncbi:MAG: hypothetical protein GY953_20085, partial [bacterium]|nr:hypothetical protein [bacterium]